MLDTISDDFSKTTKSRPLGDVLHILIVVIVNKLFKVFALFITYDLLKSYHLTSILFLTTFISSTCLLFIQRPFSSFRPSRTIVFRLIKYTTCLTIVRLLWFFGLSLCGPLRTILLFEHSDLIILVCFQVLFSSSSDTTAHQQGRTSQKRGAIFLILAVLAILAFDTDDTRQQMLDHPEGYSDHRVYTHIFYRFTSSIGVADHKGGVILLLLALFLRCAMNSVNQKLILDVGGPKKFHGITMCLSTVSLIPISFLMHFINSLFSDQIDSVRSKLMTTTTTTPSTLTSSSFFADIPSVIVQLVIISILLFVSDFYVEQVAIVKLDRLRTIRYGTWVIMSGVLLASVISMKTTAMIDPSSVWFGGTIRQINPDEHVLSGAVIFAVLMIIFATDLLLSPVKKRSGAFIGYNQEGVPIFNTASPRSQSALWILRSNLIDILAEPDSRRIFYFLCINLMFTFVELLYGAWSNSLGLISDGFHMLFDCTALVVGLYAALMARWKPTRVFSYGYTRVEVLSGFVNGLFLVVVAFFVFYEAIDRLFDPPEINTNRLLAVSIAGFAVNMIGIFSFSHAHAHGGKEGSENSNNCPTQSGHHAHSHSLTNNANMKGVFLHVLADTLGSVGVIISSILIQNFGWYISDPICSLFISVMIFVSVLPLLKESALTLLLHTPSSIKHEILERILQLENVLSYSNEHFWNLSPSVIVGTIHIQISNDGDEQYVTSEALALLKEAQMQNIAVQVEKQVFFSHLTGLNSALGQLATFQRIFSPT